MKRVIRSLFFMLCGFALGLLLLLPGCVTRTNNYVLPKTTFRLDVEKGKSKGYGSAFVFKYKGKKYIGTAGHVCSFATKILYKNTELELINYANDLIDACVIKYNRVVKGFKALDIGKAPKIGDKLSMVARSKYNAVDIHIGTRGKVKKLSTQYRKLTCYPGFSKCGKVTLFAHGVYMKTGAVLGNSGAPVLSTSRKVVGVVIQTKGRYESTYTPMSTMVKMLKGYSTPKIEYKRIHEYFLKSMDARCKGSRYLFQRNGFGSYVFGCKDNGKSN